MFEKNASITQLAALDFYHENHFFVGNYRDLFAVVTRCNRGNPLDIWRKALCFGSTSKIKAALKILQLSGFIFHARTEIELVE